MMISRRTDSQSIENSRWGRSHVLQWPSRRPNVTATVSAQQGMIISIIQPLTSALTPRATEAGGQNWKNTSASTALASVVLTWLGGEAH